MKRNFITIKILTYRNGVTIERGRHTFWSDPIALNESSIASVITALMLTLSVNSPLRSVYTKHQRQCCNDTCDTALIGNNEVAPEWGCNPF